MQIHVLHLHRESLRHPHRLVAIVEPPIGLESIHEELEYAYRWTQNLEEAWSVDQKNERVKVMAPLHLDEETGERTIGLKSTHCGDLMLAGGDLWLVKGDGFGLLTPRDQDHAELIDCHF